jgi:hypothetical protein
VIVCLASLLDLVGFPVRCYGFRSVSFDPWLSSLSMIAALVHCVRALKQSIPPRPNSL